jgi:hypothetical protein
MLVLTIFRFAIARRSVKSWERFVLPASRLRWPHFLFGILYFSEDFSL